MTTKSSSHPPLQWRTLAQLSALLLAAVTMVQLMFTLDTFMLLMVAGVGTAVLATHMPQQRIGWVVRSAYLIVNAAFLAIWIVIKPIASSVRILVPPVKGPQGLVTQILNKKPTIRLPIDWIHMQQAAALVLLLVWGVLSWHILREGR
jgi:hypothetical protein